MSYDGSTVPWAGKFFDPVIDAEYKIPEDAGNYRSLLGAIGVCIDKKLSMAHSWALIDFRDIGPIWVRTSYLLPNVDNSDEYIDLMPPLPLGEGEDPLTKFARVWEK